MRTGAAPLFLLLCGLLFFADLGHCDDRDTGLGAQLGAVKDAVIGLADQKPEVTIANSTINLGDAASNVVNSATLIFNQTEALWMQYSNDAGVGMMMAFGLLMLLFGFRLLRVMFFLAGFWFGFAVIFVFTNNYTELEYQYCLICAASTGLVIGTLAIFVLKVGLFLLGASLGFWLATFALSIPAHPLMLGPLQISIHHSERQTILQGLPQDWQYYVIVLATCIVFGLLMLTNRIQKFFVILSTSLGGAFMICCFIDHWAETGFSLAATTILHLAAKGQDVRTVRIKSEVVGLLIGCIAICFFGICFQYWNTRKRRPAAEAAAPRAAPSPPRPAKANKEKKKKLRKKKKPRSDESDDDDETEYTEMEEV